MWLVFRKEIKELLRDRKTLFFMIALPLLLFPLIFGGVAYFSGKAIEKAQTKTLNYAIIGAENAPILSAKIAEVDDLSQVNTDLQSGNETGIKALITSETVDFVLVIPATFSDDILSVGQNTLTLYLNDAGLNMVQRRLNKIIDNIAESNRDQAFITLGISEEIQKGLLEPILVDKVSTADKRENIGEKIGGLIPYIIFILCLQGAMLPATDIGAGEKERGTLETLLISPIPRNQLVMGKFFTIAFAGVTSAMVTVGSLFVWGVVLSQGMAIELITEFMGAISAVDFLLMFAMLVPIVAIFAAVLLSMSIYAKSFKEAQGYMTPLVFIVIIPIILAMLPGIKLEGIYAWVPLMNVALAIKELIKGTMDYMALIPIFLSTTAIAGLLIAFCIYWFNREKVLFR
ncbi:MAG: ABC transporter permease [Glaciecola sp.]|jgi:sodium transport system permease protein|uniref:ABC transporter permease n=1 Tax=Glaciecola sp. HTCC2999 TaxID=455436 RepID=UPI0000E11827|nr:ABC transporter permease [Glaciecola sp. HTCC2999]